MWQQQAFFLQDGINPEVSNEVGVRDWYNTDYIIFFF